MKSFFKLIPLAVKWIPLVWTAVHTVEQFATNIKGDEKKKAAIQLFGTFLTITETGLDTDLLDDNKFLEAVGKLIDAYVAVMNLVNDFSEKKNGNS